MGKGDHAGQRLIGLHQRVLHGHGLLLLSLKGHLSMTHSSYPLTVADLAQFTGTSTYYQHWLGIQYTDGVFFLAERGGAHWLIDMIASWQIDPRISDDRMLQQIQFWTLKVNEDRSAILVCERDTDDIAVTQIIPFTDFPLREIRLYFQRGILLLPSEY